MNTFNNFTIRRAKNLASQPSNEKPQREVENLIGWRKMKILPVGLLVSPLHEGGMTSTLSEEAVCDRNPKHDAPEGDCIPGCGWYAFYEAKELYTSWNRIGKDEAIVEVSAVGKTWLHDKGFRTKQIRMESIWVPKGTAAGLVETLTEMYGLPVYEIPGREEPEEPAPGADKMPPAKKGLLSKADVYKQFLGIDLTVQDARDDFLKQYMGDFTDQLGDFTWKSESGKSSSQPSPPSEPSGKSPLTSGREIQKLQEAAHSLLYGPQSRFADKRVRGQAEYDLARARAELSKALGQCILCDKTGIHGHDDLNELMEKKDG